MKSDNRPFKSYTGFSKIGLVPQKGYNLGCIVFLQPNYKILKSLMRILVAHGHCWRTLDSRALL